MIAKDLAIGYGKKVVCSEINFKLEPGKVTAIVGPNGSGKSTLLKTMCGALRCLGGSINCNGKDLFSMNHLAIAREIAVLEQHDETEKEFTVEELVEIGRYPHGSSPENGAMIEFALTRTNLLSLRSAKLGAISGGERHRARIAKTLAQSTPIVLLDEPSTHLDFLQSQVLVELIRMLSKEGKSIAVISHDLDLCRAISDEAIVLGGGKMLGRGHPNEVLAPERLMAWFEVTDPKIRPASP